jgi:hypothetical protein
MVTKKHKRHRKKKVVSGEKKKRVNHEIHERHENKKKSNRSRVISSPRCKIGGFFSLLALKGQNRPAQGNALGNEASKHFKP